MKKAIPVVWVDGGVGLSFSWLLLSQHGKPPIRPQTVKARDEKASRKRMVGLNTELRKHCMYTTLAALTHCIF